MSESIVDKILNVCKSRLELTEGVTGVYRPKKQGDFPVEDKAIIVTHDDIERDEELSCAGNPPKIAWVLPVMVAATIIPDDDDDQPIDKRMNDFIVDAMDAITISTDSAMAMLRLPIKSKLVLLLIALTIQPTSNGKSLQTTTSIN